MFRKYRLPFPVPEGRYAIDKDMKKGTAVFCKFVAATDSEPEKFILSLPTTADESKDFFGWVDSEIEFTEHKESYYDLLPANKLTRCYMRSKNDAIATTEFVGELSVGDKCVIGYEEADAGKVRKAKESETPTLIVEETFDAITAYEYAMVAVRML